MLGTSTSTTKGRENPLEKSKKNTINIGKAKKKKKKKIILIKKNAPLYYAGFKPQ